MADTSEPADPVSTRFPPEKVREGLGWSLLAKYEENITSWKQFTLVSVEHAPHRPEHGEHTWIERWKFDKVIYSKPSWAPIDPKTVKLRLLPVEPPTKRQRTASAEELEADTQKPGL